MPRSGGALRDRRDSAGRLSGFTQHRLPDRPGDANPDPAPGSGPGRSIGVDVGKVRIGVACSDPDGILATPVETVRRERSGRHLRRLAALAAELEVVEIVVGLPRTLADRPGRPPRTRSNSRRRWPPRCSCPGPARRRAVDHRQRAAIVARGRGARQGPTVRH